MLRHSPDVFRSVSASQATEAASTEAFVINRFFVAQRAAGPDASQAEDDRRLDLALADSFPASDPVSSNSFN